LTDCSQCEGTGKTYLCPECGGDRDITLTSTLHNYTVECKTCEESGAVSPQIFEDIKSRLQYPNIYTLSRCQSCYGLGKQGKETSYQIGCAHFQTRYLLLAKTLPNVSLHAFGKTDGALIVFDDGFGIIMPYFPFGLDRH
jgi:transcription elongation factor Elf1